MAQDKVEDSLSKAEVKHEVSTWMGSLPVRAWLILSVLSFCYSVCVCVRVCVHACACVRACV